MFVVKGNVVGQNNAYKTQNHGFCIEALICSALAWTKFKVM